MRTTVDMGDFPEMVIAKAIDMGIVKTKNEAIRLSVISLNKEFNLINEKDIEMQMVAKRIDFEKQEMKNNNEKYISAKNALTKYKHLIDK